jgi:hypothetical protein
MDDWYNVKLHDLQKLGGFGLFHYYNNSMIKALMAVYPEHSWQVWKFDKVPHGYWDKDSHARHFLETVEKQLGIENKADWQFIAKKTLNSFKTCKSLYHDLIGDYTY